MEQLSYPIIILGWLAYLGFLASPVYFAGGMIGGMRGWMNVLFTFLLIVSPISGTLIGSISLILNLLILASPFVLFSDHRSAGGILYIVASILAVIITIWAVAEERSSHYSWQFYLWPASMILIAIGFSIVG